LEDLLLSGAFANAFDIFRVLGYAGDGGWGIAWFAVMLGRGGEGGGGGEDAACVNARELARLRDRVEDLRFGEAMDGQIIDGLVGYWNTGRFNIRRRWDHLVDGTGIRQCQWLFLDKLLVVPIAEIIKKV
jgi:hypothetical protein